MKMRSEEQQFEKGNRYQVRNTQNYLLWPQRGEVNDLPSLTIPEQALDLKEILRRFAAGIPMDIGKMPVFDEENDLPDFTKMDLAEREEYVRIYQDELNEIRERIEAARKQDAKPPVLSPGTAQGGASSPGQNSEQSDGGVVSPS